MAKFTLELGLLEQRLSCGKISSIERLKRTRSSNTKILNYKEMK